MSIERVVCALNGYTVVTQGPDPLDNCNIQTLAGEAMIEALVRDYAAKGYRVVTPDYFERGQMRKALQGDE